MLVPLDTLNQPGLRCGLRRHRPGHLLARIAEAAKPITGFDAVPGQAPPTSRCGSGLLFQDGRRTCRRNRCYDPTDRRSHQGRCFGGRTLQTSGGPCLADLAQSAPLARRRLTTSALGQHPSIVLRHVFGRDQIAVAIGKPHSQLVHVQNRVTEIAGNGQRGDS